MPRFNDLTGKRYGRLVVLEFVGKGYWKCKCDCGNETVKLNTLLNNGHTTSCGCLHKEMVSKLNRSHGMSKSNIYLVWSEMKARCQRKSHKRYVDYGGRGITVSKEWERFENFYEDMSGTYQDGLTLDRIDNDSGYSKENCRWTDATTQNNNKRNSAYETVDGVTATRSQLADMYNVPRCTFYWRINNGLSVEEALKKPTRKSQKD